MKKILLAMAMMTTPAVAQEFPPFMYDYYQCEAVAYTRMLSLDEAGECSIIYQAFKLGFIGITLEDFATLPQYQMAYVDQEAYGALVDWRETNAALVESLISVYIELLENE